MNTKRLPKSKFASTLEKIIPAICILLFIGCVDMFFERNWGSSEFGAFVQKKHFVDDYYIKICDFTRDLCRESKQFLPAVIEYNNPYRGRSTAWYRVFVKSFTYQENGETHLATFSTPNQSYSVVAFIPPIEKRLTIYGCEIDLYHASLCIDESGRNWNIKLPFTNEVKGLPNN